MGEILQEYLTQLDSADGTTYNVRSYGEQRLDGMWTGWLEFHPTDKTKPILTTDQETSQPNRTTVEYWATGLEPIYFEGAFGRARVKT